MKGEKVVLYIEDNPANLKLVSQLIDRLDNIRLLAASRPSEGFQHLQHETIDLILLDINLPEMNGFEVLKRLRDENTSSRTIPVIAISANAMAPDIEAGVAAGFDAYLTKPFDIPRFIATLESYLYPDRQP